MQITIKTSKATIVAVPIQPGTSDYKIIHKGTRIAYFEPTYRRFDLPPGKYQLLGKPEEITEEVAGEIVERVTGWENIIYYNYAASGRDYRDIVESAFKTALQSFRSLLTSNKVVGNDYVLIKLIDK